MPGKANLGDNSFVGHGLRRFFPFADTPKKVDVIHPAKYFFLRVFLLLLLLLLLPLLLRRRRRRRHLSSLQFCMK